MTQRSARRRSKVRRLSTAVRQRTESPTGLQSEPDRKPDAFVDDVPSDRFCDLVLTGGVTSGVIYPSVAVELARVYRFKSIAGTSAGAMAAALVAAAEYRRRTGSAEGFHLLSKVPQLLGQEIDGQTRLLSLFQPTPKTRRLFRLFIDMLNESEDGSGWKWSGALASALVKQYWWALTLPIFLGVALGYAIAPLWLGALVGACAFVTAGALCIAHRIYDDLKDGVVPNGFGLCKGSETSSAQDKPALIEWLHQSIQDVAGKLRHEPLTFEDLWDVEPLPEWLKSASRDPEDDRAIDLQIVTANLTHGRPYKLPLSSESTRLFFRRSEWETYFPADVMSYLLNDKVCPPYAPVDSSDPRESGIEDLRQLPDGKLPIVVAARLSLSFPFLFSAVPVWAIDFEPRKKDTELKRELQRCWFSDGGICSNFPIHLFDNFLPKWPTFGISLGRRSVFRADEPVWLPQYHNEGRADTWNRFGDEFSAPGFKSRRAPLQRLVGFAMSIIATAKDWNDNTEMRMPGVRERVVRVGFCRGEGELNIGLSRPEIERLARDYGTAAGKKLVKTFADPSLNGATSQAWNDHRWVRFNGLLQSLRERVQTMSLAAERAPYTLPLKKQIATAFTARALQGEQNDEAPLNAAQADTLDGLLDALIQLEKQFEKYTAPQPYLADPMPSLRNRPPL